MFSSWRAFPEPAKSIAAAALGAVDAAAAGDLAAFRPAVERLALHDREQVALFLGTALRNLMESRHPDGLDADDVQALVETCVTGARGWFPTVDPDALVVVTVDALGVHAEQQLGPKTVAAHAPLLFVALLDGRPLDRWLVAAYTELAQAGSQEQP